jgi:16S rRNA C967 or C1407 C5-methylase (RsmB/RsmF family)
VCRADTAGRFAGLLYLLPRAGGEREQIDRFLARSPEFRREPPAGMTADLLSDKGDLELFPQRHGMDGAFAARLRRIA